MSKSTSCKQQPKKQQQPQQKNVKVVEPEERFEEDLLATNTVICCNKRVRALKKKLKTIEDLVKKVAEGAQINEDQKKVIDSRPAVEFALSEIEKVRVHIIEQEALDLKKQAQEKAVHDQQVAEQHKVDLGATTAALLTTFVRISHISHIAQSDLENALRYVEGVATAADLEAVRSLTAVLSGVAAPLSDEGRVQAFNDSLQHALLFIQKSEQEFVPEYSYARLSAVVDAISSSQLFNGVPKPEPVPEPEPEPEPTPVEPEPEVVEQSAEPQHPAFVINFLQPSVIFDKSPVPAETSAETAAVEATPAAAEVAAEQPLVAATVMGGQLPTSWADAEDEEEEEYEQEPEALASPSTTAAEQTSPTGRAASAAQPRGRHFKTVDEDGFVSNARPQRPTGRGRGRGRGRGGRGGRGRGGAEGGSSYRPREQQQGDEYRPRTSQRGGAQATSPRN